MKTAKCRACGQSIFLTATVCPKCGRSDPAPPQTPSFAQLLEQADTKAGRDAVQAAQNRKVLKWFLLVVVISTAIAVLMIPGCVDRAAKEQGANSCYQEGREHGRYMVSSGKGGLGSVLGDSVHIVDYCRLKEKVNSARDCFSMCKDGIERGLAD